MTNQTIRLSFLSVALAMIAGTAQAATHASRIIEDQTSYGTCTATGASQCQANDRLSVVNALGETEGAFYSLGKDGYLTLGFDTASFAPGARITLEEVTFNGPARSRHYEAVDVYSVFSDLATFVGTVYNTTKSTTLRIAQRFEHIRLVDVTSREYASTSSFDGFDVDSVKIAPVPVPAAGVLMLAGLGGLALMRRRKAAA